MMENRNVMMNRVLFIGMGHAGNKIANSFAKLGYNAIYINSSYDDLALIEAEESAKFSLPAEGCGGNRDFALELIAKEHSGLESEIMSKYNKYEYIYCLFSGCGGYGSGSGPAFAQYLANKYRADRGAEERVGENAQSNKTVGIGLILPDKMDGEEKLVNCIECYNDIMEMCVDVKNIFLIDNSLSEKQTINKSFAKALDSLFCVTKADDRTVIDPTDLSKLLKVRGCVYITDVVGQKNGSYNIIESTVFTPFVRGCKYIAMSLVDDKDYDRDKLSNYFGVPKDFVVGYSSSEVSKAFVFGMDFPNEWYERSLRWREELIERRKNDLASKTKFEFKRVGVSKDEEDNITVSVKVVGNPFGTNAKEVFSKSSNVFDKFNR